VDLGRPDGQGPRADPLALPRRPPRAVGPVQREAPRLRWRGQEVRERSTVGPSTVSADGGGEGILAYCSGRWERRGQQRTCVFFKSRYRGRAEFPVEGAKNENRRPHFVERRCAVGFVVPYFQAPSPHHLRPRVLRVIPTEYLK